MILTQGRRHHGSLGYEGRQTLSPLAPLILEHHVTGGFGYRFSERWAFDLGAIYALKNTATYTNPSLPFGPNAKESISAYYVYDTVRVRAQPRALPTGCASPTRLPYCGARFRW